jgi:hypothetical protein
VVVQEKVAAYASAPLAAMMDRGRDLVREMAERMTHRGADA